MEDYSGKAVLIYKDSENVLYEGDMVNGHAEGLVCYILKTEN